MNSFFVLAIYFPALASGMFNTRPASDLESLHANLCGLRVDFKDTLAPLICLFFINLEPD
jgi:hypothetical protein